MGTRKRLGLFQANNQTGPVLHVCARHCTVPGARDTVAASDLSEEGVHVIT